MVQSQARRVRPGPDGPGARTVIDREGRLLQVPPTWVHVPLGHPALARGLDPMAPRWVLVFREGPVVRRLGGWIPPERLQAALASAEAATPRTAALEQALVRHLDFLPRHRAVAQELARAVAGTGSGGVPTAEQPAAQALSHEHLEQSVLDWMRAHVPGVEESRLHLRRPERAEELARSRAATILLAYRGGGLLDAATCPLRFALAALAGGE